MIVHRTAAGILLWLLPLAAGEKLVVATATTPFTFAHQVFTSEGRAEFVCSPWTNVLSASLRSSAGKDLLISVSATSSVDTTAYMHQAALTSVQAAQGAGALFIRILMDNDSTSPLPLDHASLAAPPTLWTSLTNLISVAPPPTGQMSQRSAVKVAGANSYTFIKPNTAQGNHTLHLQAMVCITTFLIQASEGLGFVSLTNRTLVVEEVRAAVQ